ncbi:MULTISPECIES: hypothetical protein [unclassified Mesorhizobium]|uniref:hypothetical protein n=1 Tax=unclassified Mesorhizobium TaxID=325217 RepID=UPI001092DA1B|nr:MULTISPECIES: hypothetical protein [unclassified Mesorhizobium]TGP85920.1 hypothetical protein EN861_32405 [Mesorhizobium sp. M8A.F.Ca.ET.218.01.1.1]TGT14830.1 hypothetical protein EN856_31945 [Mesorhizobium sp. M8A.F.Ca.ET.213.01.1.1]TGT82206.1 hypothetical protein EN804_31515 [Mesorhizobium sp. M8A.F.Ca.ET.161.01.1.1]TGV35484.1 hypothetical protein EN785_31640 [Mesorhizobium sp. M8A.F.Ca.ET.142.01.1.1]
MVVFLLRNGRAIAAFMATKAAGGLDLHPQRQRRAATAVEDGDSLVILFRDGKARFLTRLPRGVERAAGK